MSKTPIDLGVNLSMTHYAIFYAELWRDEHGLLCRLSQAEAHFTTTPSVSESCNL